MFWDLSRSFDSSCLGLRGVECFRSSRGIQAPTFASRGIGSTASVATGHKLALLVSALCRILVHVACGWRQWRRGTRKGGVAVVRKTRKVGGRTLLWRIQVSICRLLFVVLAPFGNMPDKLWHLCLGQPRITWRLVASREVWLRKFILSFLACWGEYSDISVRACANCTGSWRKLV